MPSLCNDTKLSDVNTKTELKKELAIEFYFQLYLGAFQNRRFIG